MGFHNFRASTMLALALLANLATIYIVLTGIPGFPQFPIEHILLPRFIVVLVGLFALHFGYFTFKSRYRRIVEEHVEELGRSAVYGQIYMFGSLATFWVVLLVATFIF